MVHILFGNNATTVNKIILKRGNTENTFDMSYEENHNIQGSIVRCQKNEAESLLNFLKIIGVTVEFKPEDVKEDSVWNKNIKEMVNPKY